MLIKIRILCEFNTLKLFLNSKWLNLLINFPINQLSYVIKNQ